MCVLGGGSGFICLVEGENWTGFVFYMTSFVLHDSRKLCFQVLIWMIYLSVIEGHVIRMHAKRGILQECHRRTSSFQSIVLKRKIYFLL